VNASRKKRSKRKKNVNIERAGSQCGIPKQIANMKRVCVSKWATLKQANMSRGENKLNFRYLQIDEIYCFGFFCASCMAQNAFSIQIQRSALKSLPELSLFIVISVYNFRGINIQVEVFLCLLFFANKQLDGFSMNINCANVKNPWRIFLFFLGLDEKSINLFLQARKLKNIGNISGKFLLFINPKAMERKETHESFFFHPANIIKQIVMSKQHESTVNAKSENTKVNFAA
jgi:hypothetical protein